MKRSDLINVLYELYPEFGKTLIEEFTTFFFTEIGTALQQGKRVEFRGFGSFFLKGRAERTRRNPKTGELVKVAADFYPFFQSRQAVKRKNQQPRSAEAAPLQFVFSKT